MDKYRITGNHPTIQVMKEKQNQILLQHLRGGRTIHFIRAREIGIGFLNSRLSDLRKRGYCFSWGWIKIGDTRCKKYRIADEN